MRHCVIRRAVFLDFDGTVSTKDVVDELLVKFAVDDRWKKAEKEWKEGRISSAQCLTEQLRSVKLGPKELELFLSGIRLDKGFSELVDYLAYEKIPLHILSDGFELFITTILQNHSLNGMPVYANRLNHEKDRWIPRFPHESPECRRCGHCKGITLQKFRKDFDEILFAGDGLSDCCAVGKADTLFAKKSFLDYCRNQKVSFIPFEDLSDIRHELEHRLLIEHAGKGTYAPASS